jgi:hypothetical protein
MIIVPELVAEALGLFLAERLRRRFGSKSGGLIELVQLAARLARLRSFELNSSSTV